MSWKEQGRQYHMWFGHGTTPDEGKRTHLNSAVAGKSIEDRVLALAYGAIAALPATARGRVEAQYQHGTLFHLKEAMTAWVRGARLDQAAFADRFFGRAADDRVVLNLHAAALGAATAINQRDIRKAAGKLADAIKTVGVDQWPRFVADASERARDPATRADIEKSKQPPDPAQDAIRPVYPLETMIGIGATGVVSGVGAAVRAVGGVILKQLVPGNRSSVNGGSAGGNTVIDKPSGSPTPALKQGNPNAVTASTAARRPLISRQKQDGHITGTPQNRNRMKLGKPTSTFDGSPAEADALTQEAWQKGIPVPKQPRVREYNFDRRIGTGGYGGGQSGVRVYQDASGRIHGHPIGKEIP